MLWKVVQEEEVLVEEDLMFESKGPASLTMTSLIYEKNGLRYVLAQEVHKIDLERVAASYVCHTVCHSSLVEVNFWIGNA